MSCRAGIVACGHGFTNPCPLPPFHYYFVDPGEIASSTPRPLYPPKAPTRAPISAAFSEEGKEKETWHGTHTHTHTSQSLNIHGLHTSNNLV